jgi:hypothetical protein
MEESMNLSKSAILALALAQALTATAWGQVKNVSEYEKWKAAHPELVKGGSSTTATTPTPTTTTAAPTATKPTAPTKPVKPTAPTKPTTPTTPPAPQSSESSGPARSIKTEAENQALFAQFCVGQANSADVPTPNYENDRVSRAGRMLSKVADKNFYFYSDIKKIYEKPAGNPPEGISKNAHIFLTQTCGEFRDRAEMVQGKINWVNNMIMLRNEPQKQNVDLQGNIWTQLSGNSYNAYLQLSNQVFSYRAMIAAQNQELSSGLHPDAQEPVPGFSVCETKFMISEYVAKGKTFSALETYEAELKTFTAICICFATFWILIQSQMQW